MKRYIKHTIVRTMKTSPASDGTKIFDTKLLVTYFTLLFLSHYVHDRVANMSMPDC